MDRATMQTVFNKIDDMHKKIVQESNTVGRNERLHTLELLRLDLEMMENNELDQMASDYEKLLQNY